MAAVGPHPTHRDGDRNGLIEARSTHALHSGVLAQRPVERKEVAQSKAKGARGCSFHPSAPRKLEFPTVCHGPVNCTDL